MVTVTKHPEGGVQCDIALPPVPVSALTGFGTGSGSAYTVLYTGEYFTQRSAQANVLHLHRPSTQPSRAEITESD